jgi:SAM-dependent methyltransferase
MLSIKKIFSEHSLKNVKPFITGAREPFFQMAKDYVKPESVILDIGSGEGNFAKYLGRKDVYMIDGNQATVELLKKEFENIYYGKLPELPFEDNKFDVIHTSHLVEHLTPQELYDLLKEIDRCLKNGGVLVISTPLLWTGFYRDMSHLKPYYPTVFINYLSSAGHNRTRPIISSKYKVVKTQYRYGYNHSHLKSYYFIRNNLLNIFCYIIQLGIYLTGFRKLEVTGYTIVLEKTE